jgi:uncharacterized metal-binding protein YceD (DUF177 family)
MSYKHEYEIAFVGLKLGTHVYEYTIDDLFFGDFGEQDFTNCKANITLTLDKQTSFMQLKFDVGGSVEVVCDRCSNDLQMTLWDEFTVYVKYDDDPEVMNANEEDPDVFYISKGESLLSVKNWLYEFVTLSLPNQKSCSEEKMGGSQCNNEVLAYLKKSEENINQTQTNSLWKDLPNIDNDNNKN